MNVFQAHHAKELILICFQGKGDELDQLQEILAAHWSQSTGPAPEGHSHPPGRARELGPPLRGGPRTAATRQRSSRRGGPRPDSTL